MKIIFHSLPTPALPVSGSKGLISAIANPATAPLCFNALKIIHDSIPSRPPRRFFYKNQPEPPYPEKITV
jgi:hypothetical protein